MQEDNFSKIDEKAISSAESSASGPVTLEAAPLAANRAAIREFLSSFAEAWPLASLDPNVANAAPYTRHFDDVDAAADWAVGQNGRGLNIYFHVNPTRAGIDKKANKSDIAAATYLHVDIDPRAGEHIVEERERIRHSLGEGRPDDLPPPTFVIDSGGGFWGLWRLTEPIPFIPPNKDAEIRDVEARNLRLAQMLEGDKCQNIDRIARLPGTVNWPDAKKSAKGRSPAMAQVDVALSDPTRSYAVGMFAKAGAALVSTAGKSPGEATGSIHPDFDDKLRNREASAAQIALLRALAAIAETDLWVEPNEEQLLSRRALLQARYCVRSEDDLERDADGNPRRIDLGARGYSESDAAVAFAGECLRHETDLKVVMSFLMCASWPISGHVLRQGSKLRAARRAVAEAILGHEAGSRIVGIDGAPALSHEHLALLFAEHNEQQLRFVAEWGCWYIWDGQRWAKDRELRATDAVRAFARRAASGTANLKEGQARSLCSLGTIRAIETLSKADQRLAVSSDAWDADPRVLNTPSGLVDLRTGVIIPHERGHLCTKITGCAVAEPGVPPARWLAFLDELTGSDPEYISYLQRMCGYFLTGATSEHALFFAWGTGRNGKSVFTNTLRNVMGDYATSTPQETLTANTQPQHPTELADLRGARLVTAQEMEDNRRWAESRIKQMTGGDPIKARFMNQDFFEYHPQFKLFIAGNHKPGLSSINTAMQRRIHLLPFVHTVPENKVDRDLEAKLRGDAPAILRWMIDGCLLWQRDRLEQPSVVKNATEDYITSEDVIGRWIADCCASDPRSKVLSGHLFVSYTIWCAANNERPKTKNQLTSDLKGRGWRYDQTGGKRGFVGWRLTEEAQGTMRQRDPGNPF